MRTRPEIKALAKEAMRAQYGTAVLLFVVYILMSIVFGIPDALAKHTQSTALNTLYVIASWGGIIVLYVIIINMFGEYIKIYKREKAGAGALFSGLKVNFFRKLGGFLWMGLWIFLWSLLLIIPGIIKTFAYYCAPYILADCPNVTATDALKISMRITHGHKWEIFVFGISFIGWFLLSLLTLGLLWIFYVGPYYFTAISGLYVELRDKALAEGIITPQDLGM